MRLFVSRAAVDRDLAGARAQRRSGPARDPRPGRHEDPSGGGRYTGKEFLDLRDGREIWIYGQRVDDVTTHPAFRNPARMLARLCDALQGRLEQNLAFALRIADHVYLMSAGKIVHESRPDELLADEEIRARYLGV